MDHLDMSVWAWEKLADKKWGVIGKYQTAGPCLLKCCAELSGIDGHAARWLACW